MENTLKPHAVVFPFPTVGHVTPMLHLATRLALDGILISFIVSEFNQNSSPLHSPHPSIRTIALPDGLPPNHVRTSDIAQLCHTISFAPTMRTSFLDFLQASQGSHAPVTCIIADTFVLFAQDAAKAVSVPYAAFWTQSAASYTCMLRVTNGYRPSEDPEALIAFVAGIPTLKQNEINTFLQSYDTNDIMFEFLTRPFRRIAEADWILINTFQELESETLNALREEHNVSSVGPILPPEIFQPLQLDDRNSQTGGDLDVQDCMKWLDLHSPASVLYVSFGSLAVMSREQLTEFAHGLEGSGQTFLWVLRKDLIYGASPAVPDGFEERTRGRAYFMSWAPQLKVLRHPSIGGFLTHCGWNSVLESISAGVPMLCWSYFSDQLTNRRCVVDVLKVGLCWETAGELKEKVRELMQEDTRSLLIQNAQAWRTCAFGAVKEGGSSFHSMKLVMNFICQTVREQHNT